MAKDDTKVIQETTEELLKLLEIEGDASVSKTDESIEIVLDTPDSGMVIGYHGETLDALQLVLALCISKKTGEFQRVMLEVGDYKKNRAEYLKNLVAQTKDRVLSENQEISLPDLKAWERRTIHMLLQDDTEVMSESVGEGKERTLIVKKR